MFVEFKSFLCRMLLVSKLSGMLCPGELNLPHSAYVKSNARTGMQGDLTAPILPHADTVAQSHAGSAAPVHGLRARHEVHALVWLPRRLRRGDLIAHVVPLLRFCELLLAGVLRDDRPVSLRELHRRLSAPCRPLTLLLALPQGLVLMRSSAS